MKSLELKHLSAIVVIAAAVKFLLDGVTFSVNGHPMDLGHLDSMTYATFLTPVLGAHGWVLGRGSKTIEEAQK